MKILMRPHKGQKWKVVETTAYTDEKQLQKLLDDSPEIVSLDEIRPDSGPLVAAVREFNLPVGSIDILAFTARGDIAIIECKRAKNTQAKREVIGQILDYAAHLWETTYEVIDDKVKGSIGKSLADFVHAKCGEGWDEEAFRANVRAGLADGSFILVIVVDEINDELNRIVRYVNAAGSPSFSFAALEMRRFVAGNAEMLVPHVFGAVVKTKPSAALKNKWNADTFFPELFNRHGELAETTARSILAWAEVKKIRIWWGEGTRSGSFVPIYTQNGLDYQLFAVWTYGTVEIYFFWYQYKPPFESEEKRFEMLQHLNEIPGVNLPKEVIGRRPNIKLSVLSNGIALEKFFRVFQWYIEEVEKAAGTDGIQSSEEGV